MEDITGEWTPYRLNFLFEARTSRASMRHKDTYFVRLRHPDGREGWGEAALFKGLSADDCPDFERVLSYYCQHPEEIEECRYSAVRFGIESALRQLDEGRGPWPRNGQININGLIWMGDKATMKRRIEAKLSEGFRLLKLKIGGIDFNDELDLLREIRRHYGPDVLELRLDANGSFSPEDALRRLEVLAQFGIHSIEQPVRAGQPEVMRRVCAESPIPIALDEELIGCSSLAQKCQLLESVKPAYIILKPALCGGLSGAAEWRHAATEAGIGYWYTSALESNIGLDAIAREVLEHGLTMPQGLGTGELYDNNIPSPVMRNCAVLTYDRGEKWHFPILQWNTRAF